MTDNPPAVLTRCQICGEEKPGEDHRHEKIGGHGEPVRECPDCGETLETESGFDVAGPGKLHSYIYCPNCDFYARETWKIAETRRTSR